MKSALRGQRVLVHGLAKSGLAAIPLLLREGAKVSALDAKPEAELGELPKRLREQGVELFLGPTPQGLHERCDLVVVSPGVPLSLPEICRARRKGIPVWGEVELASRFLQGPVLGITGTNGKSTTTALAGELLKQSGKRAFVGGNLGRPLSEAPLEAPRFDAYVVELSSFQLEGIERMRVNAAALLNLTPDHLDRYASHEEYGKAKARIFLNQGEGDVAVVNADDEAVVALSRCARVPVVGFTLRPEVRVPEWFAGAARAAGEGFEVELPGRPLARFSVRARSLRGRHNLQNAMAAALLALHAGAGEAGVQSGLDSYPGLAHRLELVRELGGVEWVNDSKGTNVDSTLVALAAFPGNLWLIAGGKGKGAPYAPMVEASRGRVKGVLTIGKDAKAIEAAYQGAVPVHPCETLERAVAAARELSRPGDVVLLSPACASYDQFKNFEDRGEQFKRMVGALT